MSARNRWSRSLAMVGLAGMIISALDPLEGAVIAFVSAALIALGAQLTHSRFRNPLYWSVGMIGVGFAVMIALSAVGGVGGSTGRPLWWAAAILPYPMGWLIAVIFGVRKLRERLV